MPLLQSQSDKEMVHRDKEGRIEVCTRFVPWSFVNSCWDSVLTDRVSCKDWRETESLAAFSTSENGVL